ncbi:MAG: hypothetical protein LBL34_01020 [Clostridiales bacterium]|nr:hypothetical protein [Clostridiales bacterium]
MENDQLAKRLKKSTEATNAKLLETAYRAAVGYYVEEDEAFKIKTFEEVDGKTQAVERIEIVKVKKHIPANMTMNMFMIKSRIPEYSDDKPLDGALEVIMSGDAEEYAM